MKNLLSMEALTVHEIEHLLEQAAQFKRGKKATLNEQAFAVNMFFEPSTRTLTSFEVAEKKLGVELVSFDAASSSMTKGETLYDTLLTMQAVGVNVAVIRHSEENYYEGLEKLDIALVNAGDGCGEHPSQSLLDLFTIKEQFGTFQGLKVAIAGDIRHSRVANSNMKVLKRLGAELYFSGPKEWFDESYLEFGTYLPVDEIVEKVDVMMLLRVQHERHSGKEQFTKEGYHSKFGLTTERAAKLKPDAIIMHPSPVNRDVEIADSLVESGKSRIVTQMTNGVFIRMAILESILKEQEMRAELCTY
ncbi:aspartate carbamoyltransferase catalytic subunit [Listeria seeligeri]|uniref:aspartate carbamoyltransferase catalytic subunit n=1 Tax=Listeria seeligeri TaxID=1640 RepID=UPI0018874C24|nr:aspartate carbamoyltransferase catalytic subunit [Listeria seeligeri]MBF2346420.1 aspartate carbamoyltransferase catalytic subunit [Listeria seeligeri]MBF2601043.1 aspartate carbamoyltransferase catalytic subunit [Listeria seeligeri]